MRGGIGDHLHLAPPTLDGHEPFNGQRGIIIQAIDSNRPLCVPACLLQLSRAGCAGMISESDGYRDLLRYALATSDVATCVAFLMVVHTYMHAHTHIHA